MKKLISFLLCLLLLGALPCSVLATSDEYLTVGPLIHPVIDPIVDDGELLTAEDENALAQKTYNIYNEHGIWVCIVTVESLGYKSAEAYADDYYDQNYYSMYPDGVLLLISMEYRDWAISTCGRTIDLLTDQELDDLFDEMAGYLGDNEFVPAFHAYLDALPVYLAPREATFLDYVRIVLVALVIGAIAGGISVGVMQGKMNTAQSQSGASDYIVDGTYDLHHSRDVFLYSHVSRTAKPKDTSTHRSSGGVSHGGRSGKF